MIISGSQNKLDKLLKILYNIFKHKEYYE